VRSRAARLQCVSISRRVAMLASSSIGASEPVPVAMARYAILEIDVTKKVLKYMKRRALSALMPQMRKRRDDKSMSMNPM
jgi:hypothetical protein